MLYEGDIVKEEIASLDTEIGEKLRQHESLLTSEGARMTDFDSYTSDVLAKAQTTAAAVTTAPDICADVRAALMSCYKTGSPCVSELQIWKTCEAQRS
jgi:hypothetical protein